MIGGNSIGWGGGGGGGGLFFLACVGEWSRVEWRETYQKKQNKTSRQQSFR